MEMLGLNLQCIDTASLTVEALGALAGMADALGDADISDRCRRLVDPARARMEEAFWMEEEGLYGDMVASPAEMAPRLRHWMDESSERPAAAEFFRHLLEKAESDSEQDRKRPWLLKNWSVLSPLEGGLSPPDRAARTLQRAEGPELTGPWGVYICGTYGTAMMSISTGVMAAAEAEYDRPVQALRYIRLLTDTLELQSPGAIAEMSPDYGCFVQAWSGYAVAWPVVAGIFGVKPDSLHRRITLTPSFPPGWSDARLSNLSVGTNLVDLRWDGTTLWVTSRETGWDIRCDRLPMRLEQGSEPGGEG
jgi:glycogen debranching enzyme